MCAAGEASGAKQVFVCVWGGVFLIRCQYQGYFRALRGEDYNICGLQIEAYSVQGTNKM